MKWGIQKRISELTGLSESYVSRLINGKQRPSWPVAKNLAKITKTTPELWLEGTPEDISTALESVDLSNHNCSLSEMTAL